MTKIFQACCKGNRGTFTMTLSQCQRYTPHPYILEVASIRSTSLWTDRFTIVSGRPLYVRLSVCALYRRITSRTFPSVLCWTSITSASFHLPRSGLSSSIKTISPGRRLRSLLCHFCLVNSDVK